MYFRSHKIEKMRALILGNELCIYVSLPLGRRYKQSTRLPATAAGLRHVLSPCPHSSCQPWLRGFITPPEPSRSPAARGSADRAGGSLSLPPSHLDGAGMKLW